MFRVREKRVGTGVMRTQVLQRTQLPSNKVAGGQNYLSLAGLVFYNRVFYVYDLHLLGHWIYYII